MTSSSFDRNRRVCPHSGAVSAPAPQYRSMRWQHTRRTRHSIQPSGFMESEHSRSGQTHDMHGAEGRVEGNERKQNYDGWKNGKFRVFGLNAPVPWPGWRQVNIKSMNDARPKKKRTQTAPERLPRPPRPPSIIRTASEWRALDTHTHTYIRQHAHIPRLHCTNVHRTPSFAGCNEQIGVQPLLNGCHACRNANYADISPFPCVADIHLPANSTTR